MDDLARLMLAAQAAAHEIAESTEELPEKAEVSARFHMDGSFQSVVHPRGIRGGGCFVMG